MSVPSPRTHEARAKAAERAKRWRKRQKQGRRPLLVEMPDRFASTLVDRDLLGLGEVDDTNKLAAKATEIIEEWIMRNGVTDLRTDVSYSQR